MTTGDVVYSLRFSLIKILPEPGFDLGSTAGESCVLTARLHMLYCTDDKDPKKYDNYTDASVISIYTRTYLVHGYACIVVMIHIVCWCGHNKRYIANNYIQEKQQNNQHFSL